MLAAMLISRFVFSKHGELTEEYKKIYALSYGNGKKFASLPANGRPPTQGHAMSMAKTLREWGEELKHRNLQVHQEGALSRFKNAQNAPGYGRHPGAVAARKKTLGFYYSVLVAAIAKRRCNTFDIPAMNAQAYEVAVEETSAAKERFVKATQAVESLKADMQKAPRPELETVLESARKTQSRAVNMHNTAMAEAVACGIAAEGGAEFRVVHKASELPVDTLRIGIEVVKNSNILPCMHANLDPQHGGGVFGFGMQVEGAMAACDAAFKLVAKGLRLPRQAKYFTNRADPDSVMAWLILSGKIPVGIVDANYERLLILANLDNGDAEPAWVWQPGYIVPQTVSDSPTWGTLSTLCFEYTKGHTTLEMLEEVAIATLTGSTSPVTAQAKERWEQASVRATEVKFQLRKNLVYAVDAPVGPGLFSQGYAKAPIVLLQTHKFPFRDREPGLKYTVAICREAGPYVEKFVVNFRERMAKLEAGWDGPTSITGSPMNKPSTLPLQAVIQEANLAATACGLPALTPDTSTTNAHAPLTHLF